MPLKRSELERQLEQATKELEKNPKNGAEKSAQRRDPMWRHLNAKVRQLKGRLNAVAATEARDAEAEKRRAEAGG